jgi:hypothetical protein
MVTRRKKLWLLLFAGAAIVALTLLSATLHELELSRFGRPLPATGEPFSLAGIAPWSGNLLNFLYVAFFVLGSVLILVGIVYVIVSRKARKDFLRRFMYGLLPLLILVAIRVWIGSVEEPPTEATPGPPGQPIAAQDVAEAVPPPVLNLDLTPPKWSVWFVAIVLALLIATALVAVVWYLWLRKRRPAGALEQLAQEAQEALDALLAGEDLRDAVMRCYFEMSRVLWLQRGLIRQEAMTPREFEVSLREVGLPDRAIRQLTRLFEGVRYGAKEPGPAEARQAVDCLTTIVQACRSSA